MSDQLENKRTASKMALRNAQANNQGISIHITGVVQGVGFRPFVYNLARQCSLTGWVRNTSAGVDIEADGAPQDLLDFTGALQAEAPPLARIDSMEVRDRAANGFTSFEIILSESQEGAFQPVSPDVSICDDCLRELLDPVDRRYRYPFINCTNCGPRFTIIKDIPYDRPLTTMASFAMCPECAAEYHDPLNRRFHAQPVACPICGPQIWLESGGGTEKFPQGESALQAARKLLAGGGIVAVKGLGGFHLACDATNAAAVEALREQKLRVDKAFAIMMRDLDAISAHCYVNKDEAELLQSRQRPIVILRRRPDSTVAREVAPRQETLGVMLPYTPLHVLLLGERSGLPDILVMTSGNLSEEPIASTNQDARERLSDLVDAFLMHDRDIHTRCDDSVVRAFSFHKGHQEAVYHLRRARGYAPGPIRLPWDCPPVLATGAELKNTFCLLKNRYAFLSHHIGDMENFETLQAFEEGIHHYEQLFRVVPALLACDLHPDYLATRYAQQRAADENLPLTGVQHHYAHIVSCMAEHGLERDEMVIGVSFDGTGYGEDGTIWGGEIFIAGYLGFERSMHLNTVPLPGGDRAIKEPWRIALAWLHAAACGWDERLEPVKAARAGTGGHERLTVLRRQLETGINAPPTSSMGRLFDAVASLVGLRQMVNYEAQAAIELEAIAENSERGSYPYTINDGVLNMIPAVESALSDTLHGVAPSIISARFHNTVAAAVVNGCETLRRKSGINRVVLSGGVWQNMHLLRLAANRLHDRDFILLIHRQVPANDGGLALGQAVAAAFRQGLN